MNWFSNMVNVGIFSGFCEHLTLDVLFCGDKDSLHAAEALWQKVATAETPFGTNTTLAHYLQYALLPALDSADHELELEATRVAMKCKERSTNPAKCVDTKTANRCASKRAECWELSLRRGIDGSVGPQILRELKKGEKSKISASFFYILVLSRQIKDQMPPDLFTDGYIKTMLSVSPTIMYKGAFNFQKNDWGLLKGAGLSPEELEGFRQVVDKIQIGNRDNSDPEVTTIVLNHQLQVESLKELFTS